MKSRKFWLTKKTENKVVLCHCTRTEIRTEKHRQVVFLQRRWGYHILLVSLILRTARYQRIHLMEQPNESIYFHVHSEVNLQCSAVFSLVASRNDGHFLRLYKRVPPVNDPTAMPCLWALSKGETAVHGCHCLGDLAVCMLEVLARPWDGECLPLVLPL